MGDADKIRATNMNRAAAIRAKRIAATVCEGCQGPAAAFFTVDGAGLPPEQLLSVQEEVFSELCNNNQTPIQQEMPVDTTLEKTGAKDARIATADWISSCFLFWSAAPATLSSFRVPLFNEITGITSQVLMFAAVLFHFWGVLPILHRRRVALPLSPYVS